MSYTTEDFSDNLARVALSAQDIETVVAAWGKGDGQGEDAGHYRHSEEGVSDWSGGFLMRLKDGRYAYLTGWCDFTGWGCQDGAELHFYDVRPHLGALMPPQEFSERPVLQPEDWDHDPTDLNRWLESAAEAHAES